MATSLHAKTKKYSDYLGFYEPLDIGYADDDIYFVVPSTYEYKPGAIAEILYGSARYFWVLGYFNPDTVSDLIFDIKEGLILRLPTKDRLLRAL